jgi:hypothetical protein
MTSAPLVAVIGARPAGLAAVCRLRDQGGVHTVLVVPQGRSEYLPDTLAVATGDARAIEQGVVDVVISSLPYRCPPAPYGLAMRLARRTRRLGKQLQVRLGPMVTPTGGPFQLPT